MKAKSRVVFKTVQEVDRSLPDSRRADQRDEFAKYSLQVDRMEKTSEAIARLRASIERQRGSPAGAEGS